MSYALFLDPSIFSLGRVGAKRSSPYLGYNTNNHGCLSTAYPRNPQSTTGPYPVRRRWDVFSSPL